MVGQTRRARVPDHIGLFQVSIPRLQTRPISLSMSSTLKLRLRFEMIGLYPPQAKSGPVVLDSMAAVLLRRLGLPEPAPPEPLPKIGRGRRWFRIFRA
jgi:hypothetical protein